MKNLPRIDDIGRYINKSNKGIEDALSRYSEIFPLVERGRDFLNFDLPFTMDFKIKVKGNRITLDLNFNLPTPELCCIEAVCDVCERKIALESGPLQTFHTVHTINAVTAVWINDALQEGVTTFDGTSVTINPYLDERDEIVICYTYTEGN